MEEKEGEEKKIRAIRVAECPLLLRVSPAQRRTLNEDEDDDADAF